MRIIYATLLLLAACQANAATPSASASPVTAEPASATVAPQQPISPIAAALSAPVPASTATLPLPRGSLTIAGRTLPVDIAETYESRKQGLSGRPSLAENTGLILGWSEPQVVSIWMPDMNFAIDVIFVASGKVVAIYPDAQPCAPNGPCPTFGPSTPVDFVAEVPAGSAARWGLTVGSPAAYKH